MILYHPAKDLNHCIYRVLSILFHSGGVISKDKLRVLDFYYIFPHLLKEITPWPTDIKEFKKITKNIPMPFEKISNHKRLFFELTEMQEMSLSMLHSKGLIENDSFRGGEVILVNELLPLSLVDVIQSDKFHKTDVFKTIVVALQRTVWEGKQGLKNRTGLLEFKYDE